MYIKGTLPQALRTSHLIKQPLPLWHIPILFIFYICFRFGELTLCCSCRNTILIIQVRLGRLSGVDCQPPSKNPTAQTECLAALTKTHIKNIFVSHSQIISESYAEKSFWKKYVVWVAVFSLLMLIVLPQKQFYIPLYLEASEHIPFSHVCACTWKQ